jgi:hypothetical protein
VDAGRERLIAANEALARDVNEAIERGQWPGEENQPAAYRCECGRSDCNRLIELTPGDYERVRQHPRQFVVVPGHEQLDVETVVERAGTYAVVVKRGEAGEVADATDSRD